MGELNYCNKKTQKNNNYVRSWQALFAGGFVREKTIIKTMKANEAA